MARRTRNTAVVVLCLLALVALLAGCSAAGPAPASGTGAAQPPSSASTAAAPTVRVVEPADGASVKGTDLQVRVEVSGLRLVMPSTTRVTGEGHVHFTLDDQPIKMSTATEYVFSGVAPGQHTLRAELVQNDTTPFDPAVVQTVTFTVE